MISDRYREYREAFIWIVKNYISEKWCEKHSVNYEKILINMIHLLDITFREISDKRDVSDNRRLKQTDSNLSYKGWSCRKLHN